MKEGMVISIKNTDCLSLTVKAGKGLKRFFTWNNGTRSIVLLPRKEKWYGSYGAYFPGTGIDWKEHDGVTNIQVEEAVLNFESYAQILCAISNKNDHCRQKYYKFSNGKFDFQNTMTGALYTDACGGYTSNGIYISIGKRVGPGNGDTLSITIYKIMLNGQPVKNLPGDSNERITVSYP